MICLRLKGFPDPRMMTLGYVGAGEPSKGET